MHVHPLPIPVASFSSEPYPGEIPSSSYFIVDGEVRALDAPDGSIWAEWIAQSVTNSGILLAYGSNASPARLRQKFGEDLDGFVAFMGRVVGAQRVYSQNRTRRGTLAYSLVSSPGHSESAHVLFVPRRHCELMDRTEGRRGPYYLLARLEEVRWVSDSCSWNSPVTYLGHADRGPAKLGDRPAFVSELTITEAETSAESFAGDDSLLPRHEAVPFEVSLFDATHTPRDREFVSNLLSHLSNVPMPGRADWP